MFFVYAPDMLHMIKKYSSLCVFSLALLSLVGCSGVNPSISTSSTAEPENVNSDSSEVLDEEVMSEGTVTESDDWITPSSWGEGLSFSYNDSLTGWHYNPTYVDSSLGNSGKVEGFTVSNNYCQLEAHTGVVGGAKNVSTGDENDLVNSRNSIALAVQNFNGKIISEDTISLKVDNSLNTLLFASSEVSFNRQVTVLDKNGVPTGEVETEMNKGFMAYRVLSPVSDDSETEAVVLSYSCEEPKHFNEADWLSLTEKVTLIAPLNNVRE